MIISTADAKAGQQQRLSNKNQDQQLINKVVAGTGLSPWEATVLVEIVQEVYFTDAAKQPLRSGQLRYDCVQTTEGAGKPVKQCQTTPVHLTLLDSADPAFEAKHGHTALRQLRIQRLTEEAREQGGLLTQEDLAQLLFCDVRTIRRDIAELREKREIHVATRGQQKDIGPGVTHKGVALRLWLEGKEPVEVARQINHTLHAVERYIQHFCRVAFLWRKSFAPLQIALTVGISSASVKTYLDIYETYAKRKEYQRRFEELEVIGAHHYQAEDAKKGALLPESATGSNGRRP